MIESYRLLMADIYELAGLSRRVSDREAAAMGSTAAQWHVLSAVSDQPAPVPAIARRLGLVRQSVQRVVDDLAADGRVTLRANPGHRRSALVGLTDSGRDVLNGLWESTTPERETVLAHAGVSDDELDAARTVVRRLISALAEQDRST